MNHSSFKKIIWNYYKENARSMPWRENFSPYNIVVSEIMLQQTQASRVAPKFESFIKKFPDFTSLTKAPLSRVLKEWQGLGYNRRAVSLQKIAKVVEDIYTGRLPKNYEKLADLPGIGPNTAGSILAFAFNIPVVFIETNIRSVFIHFFFKDKRDVRDKDLLVLIEKTLDKNNPREWYYALMDYGSFLKKTKKNPSRQSKHHVKQSKFKGSNRELRAMILRELLKKPGTEPSLRKIFEKDISDNLINLQKEGFIILKNKHYSVL